MRLRILVVALLAALAAFAATAPQADASRVPRLKHVWVFVLENHSYDEIIDNPDVPYLNHLAHRHGMATQYYAVAHPSLPNYLAMISGSTHSCTSNGCQGNYRGRTLAGPVLRPRAAVAGLHRGPPGARLHRPRQRDIHPPPQSVRLLPEHRPEAAPAEPDRPLPRSSVAA